TVVIGVFIKRKIWKSSGLYNSLNHFYRVKWTYNIILGSMKNPHWYVGVFANQTFIARTTNWNSSCKGIGHSAKDLEGSHTSHRQTSNIYPFFIHIRPLQLFFYKLHNKT